MAPVIPVTCFRLKFSKNTYFIFVDSSTTISILKGLFISAIKESPQDDGDDLELPSSTEEICLWRLLENEEGVEEEWEKLDSKAGADKWGLLEAAEIGVSVKQNGKFNPPEIIRPVDEEDS